jgi:hypothetical protein
MRSTTIGVMIVLIIIMLSVSVFGGHWLDQQSTIVITGGIGERPTVSTEQPSAWDALSWIWDSLSFAFLMTTFQISGLPAIFSVIWDFMGLLTILCIIFLARGGGN